MSDLIDRSAIKLPPHFFEDVDNVPRFYEWLNSLPTASPWHRVEEELPEIGKIVLVYDNWDRLSICQLDNQYRWLRQGGGWFDVPYVRYWMPIEPPKEETK